MELTKVLLLCLAILLGCTRESKSMGFDPTEKSISIDKDNEYQTINFDDEECFCFPKNHQGVHVSDKLALDGEQERLVVYLYKNKNNKVTVYIPNREKQALLPDLPLDDDDKIDNLIDTEKVTDLFSMYPKFVIPNVLKNVKNIIDASLSFKPIFIGHLQGILPNIYNPLNEGFHWPGQPTHETDPGKKVNLNFEIKSPNERYIDFPIGTGILQQRPDGSRPDTSINKIFFGKPEIPNVSEYLSNYNYFPNINGLPGSGNFAAHQPKPIEKNENVVKVTKQKPHNESRLILMPETSVPENDKNFFLKVPIIFTHQQQREEDTPYDDMMFVPTPDLIEEFQSYLNKGDKFPSNPQKDVIFTPNKEYSDHHKILKPGKEFEQWFQKQLAVIQQNRHTKSQPINKNELRTFILHALHKNGIIVTKSGNLIDSNGNFLDLTKLRLRPILLGDPKEYHKLVASQKCVIPHKIPYLEAILVTLSYPPKILGIVPLGKSLKEIPFEAKQHCNTGKCEKQQNCMGSQCKKDKMKAYKTDKIKFLTAKGRPSMNLRPKGQDFLNKFMKDSVTKTKSKSGFNFEDEQSLENSVPSGYIEYNKLEENDDSLGLKIIGGNPAVGSGAIVKNKGRSGQSFD